MNALFPDMKASTKIEIIKLSINVFRTSAPSRTNAGIKVVHQRVLEPIGPKPFRYAFVIMYSRLHPAVEYIDPSGPTCLKPL